MSQNNRENDEVSVMQHNTYLYVLTSMSDPAHKSLI